VGWSVGQLGSLSVGRSIFNPWVIWLAGALFDFSDSHAGVLSSRF